METKGLAEEQKVAQRGSRAGLGLTHFWAVLASQAPPASGGHCAHSDTLLNPSGTVHQSVS